MAKKNNKKGFVGIYISPKEIALAEVSVKGSGKLQPEHLIKFPTDFSKRDGAQRPLAQNASFFKSDALWVSKFKNAVGKVDWGAHEAVISLSENFGILRYFSMPAIQRKYWSKSIPLESKKYIPIAFDDVDMDYDAFPTDGGKKLSVLFGISQKETVAFLTNLMKDVGFKLNSVEISPVSMERFFTFVDPKDHLRHGYVHAADDSTQLLFSTGGRPVLHREFGNDEGMSERRRLDIKGAIQYVDRYTDGEGFNTIVLSGDYAQALKDVVEKEANPLPVMMLDLEEKCGTKELSSSALFAMGAALYGKAASDLRMDISGVSTTIRINSEVQRFVYGVGIFVIAVLLLMIVKGRHQLSSLTNELQGYKDKTENSELTGSNAEEIRSKIDAIKNQSSSLGYAFSKNDFIAPKLSVLVDEIPKQLWIENITYSNPVSLSNENLGNVTGSNVRIMKISGGTYLTGEPRAQVTEGFLKELKKYENEFKPFISPLGNMTLSVSAASKSRLSPVDGTQPNDGVSKFDIDCIEGGK